MQKAYNPTVWENTPSINTPLNETNLNKLSQGVSEIDNRVITLDLTKLSITEANGLVKSIELNQDTGDITITYYSGSTSVLHTLMAQIAINFSYDPVTERLIIYLKDGTEQYIDLSALITQFEFLDSDTVYWSIGDDGKVKADIKRGSITGRHHSAGRNSNTAGNRGSDICSTGQDRCRPCRIICQYHGTQVLLG